MAESSVVVAILFVHGNANVIGSAVVVRADLYARSEMDLTEADRGPPIGGGLTDKQAGDLHAVFANKECCISFPALLNQLDVDIPRDALCA